MNIKQAEDRVRGATGTLPGRFLLVDTPAQSLAVVEKGTVLRQYPVSTSKFGAGNRENSLMTPQGVHRIVEKYGRGAPLGRIFRDRLDTGETWTVGTRGARGAHGESLILTRILRLEGLEDGINRGQGIDSYERYIYIHGTNNETSIGFPSSHGCVCMTNSDVVELFDDVTEGTIVVID
jgi:lipoprotein-anchoring transpeptidase ErfK/SrfK